MQALTTPAELGAIELSSPRLGSHVMVPASIEQLMSIMNYQSYKGRSYKRVASRSTTNREGERLGQRSAAC